MKICAIICAAGKGVRAGFRQNKMLAPLCGAPVLYHTLKKFSFADEIIVTHRETDREEFEAICSPFGAKLVPGGETRMESVYNALKEATGEIVLIHDGARPFVSQKVISSCLQSVHQFGSGVAAMPVTDTVSVVKDGKIMYVPERDAVYALQTPQAFYTADILKAYERAITDGTVYTDDSSIYSKYIEPSKIVPGEKENKKLTYAEDFISDESRLFEGADKAGFGVDVHAFGEGDKITLCGTDIPFEKTLLSHTDGDCAIHALADALLSAAGLKDIGTYFPDTDEKWKGAPSKELLKETVKIIRGEGYRPKYVSLSIQAQRPRLSPYIDRMKHALGAILLLGDKDIAISAGTGEGLGFVGEERGISAYCLAGVEEIKDGEYVRED